MMRHVHSPAGASLSRRSFLPFLGACLPKLSRGDFPGKKPNIVLILADDLGYGDLGCYGGRIPTPNIDQLAHSGVRFTRAYSAAPICSASRAALLTGRYSQRLGIAALNSAITEDSRQGLPNVTEDGMSVVTIADILRSQGYRTACVGKWHLGHGRDAFLPVSHGFSEFHGIPYSNNMSPLSYMDGMVVIDAFDDKRERLMARIADDALNFIAGAQTGPDPFFLYLAFTAPHIPLTPSENFKGVSGMSPYADTVMELDFWTGKILQSLGENTLVVFLSDNGAEQDPALDPILQGNTGGRAGGKYSTQDGGILVPLIISFSGRISGGRTSEELVSLMDILPTLGILGGFPVQYENPDGADLWPHLAGDSNYVMRPNSLLAFRFESLECGIRQLCDPDGNMHLFKIRISENGNRLKEPQLFDLAADPSEKSDVARRYEQVARNMAADMQEQLSFFPHSIKKANPI